MRNRMVWLFLFLSSTSLPTSAVGGNSVVAASACVSAQATTSKLVITPFAVPVAVPVATVNVSRLFYRYQTEPVATHCVPPRDEPPEGVVPEPNAKQPTAETSGAEVVTRKCAACHREGNAGNGLILDGVAIGSLDRPARLEILRRITTSDPNERMPRRGELSAEEREWLLEQLVR